MGKFTTINLIIHKEIKAKLQTKQLLILKNYYKKKCTTHSIDIYTE